ncbi:MAG: LysM peptidoglycan-binding domain-containing protein [Lachnospiraceae bacterium]|nr:LysM peptidoglycan-binding domain-containing protein [Lachnospiraceae bacterium]
MDFIEYVKMCQEDEDSEERREKLCSGLIYKVEAGDTLYSISRKYELRVRDLMRANPFVNVYNLQIGEELCIPVAPGNKPVEGARPYVVKKGDTILSILEENKLDFEELARLNRSVAVLTLLPGTILLLPTKVEQENENLIQN